MSFVTLLEYLGNSLTRDCIGCSFTFILKVGVEESIVNAPLIADHGYNLTF
jgi:hypothetical protein